jgi:hypothetical protein
MAEKCYFDRRKAHTDEEETTLEPMEDKVVILDDFFLA